MTGGVNWSIFFSFEEDCMKKQTKIAAALAALVLALALAGCDNEDLAVVKTLGKQPPEKQTAHFTFSGNSLRIELEAMETSGFDITADANASGGKAGKLVDENSRADATITFPAGTYTGYAVIRAPSPDNDMFYVKFGDDYIRVYANEPSPPGYAPTNRTPIYFSCRDETTVQMTIQKDNPDPSKKPGETGMFIDYVEFTKSVVPENGKPDWTGFKMVDSVDKLDFTFSTYNMQEVWSTEYKGETPYVGTELYTVKVATENEISVTRKSTIRKYNNAAVYAEDKVYYEEEKDKYGDCTRTYDDSTRTITILYPEKPYSQSLSGFKQAFLSLPEDEAGTAHRDLKLGQHSGIIQVSYICDNTWTEDDGTVETDTTYFTTTLTPQK